MEKDIILIIGGGGMSGVFSSGVLKALEDDSIYRRVHSIYAVSVGGCTGARFVVRQSELGGRTFYTRFNTERFISDHFARYFFQILRRKKEPNTKVDELLHFDYFTEVLLSSEDKIDMEKVKTSGIPLYVKVFNNTKKIHEYLLMKGPHAYENLLASASMTPLTSRSIAIEGQELFDGDTISSPIEIEIAKNNPEKLVIKIDNTKSSFLRDLNLFTMPIVYILLRSMYGAGVSNLYFKNFFKRLGWRRALKRERNVVVVENPIAVSAFSKDTELLKKAYQEGLAKGEELLRRVKDHHVVTTNK